MQVCSASYALHGSAHSAFNELTLYMVLDKPIVRLVA